MKQATFTPFPADWARSVKVNGTIMDKLISFSLPLLL